VGFVTPLLVMALSERTPWFWLAVHHGGLAAMVSGLAMVAIGPVVLGMSVAVAGAVVLWIAGLGWAWQLLRGATRRVPWSGSGGRPGFSPSPPYLIDADIRGLPRLRSSVADEVGGGPR
jgi:hypothetical protein